eukprot:scaffold321227_cov32-Tisochrysis_lutea.AAC.6
MNNTGARTGAPLEAAYRRRRGAHTWRGCVTSVSCTLGLGQCATLRTGFCNVSARGMCCVPASARPS